MRRDVFHAISDPTRREILNLIADKPLTVNSVAIEFKISRPAVSKHVRILKECGLITIRKKGRERFCEPKFQKLREVSAWVEKYRKFWTEKLNALEEFLETLTPEQMTQPNIVGDWSAKDILGHLIEWEQMVVKWHEAGAKGKAPAVPSEEYNWAQLPQLNHAIYLKHRGRSLADIQKDFESSYKKIMKTIQAIPEKELFTRGQFAWTRNNALAAYFVSGTSSHYRWARTALRKGFNLKKSK